MKFSFRAAMGAILSALALTVTAAPAAESTPYTIAIIPSAPPVAMNNLWTPFVERLSKSTGLQFKLKHYEKMAEFERDIWNGGPDFIFSSPIQLVVAHASSGYAPLVRGNDPVAVGLFVRADSPVRHIEDLMGKKISFVGNKNVCSVAMQHLLSEHGKNLDFDREYAGSTRNVIINVLMGKTDAGAIFLPEMEREPQETRSQLREVVETPPISPHALSANPRVAKSVQNTVAKATISMAATPDGAELLKNLRLANPVPADYRRDYRALEAMDVKGLTNWGR